MRQRLIFSSGVAGAIEVCLGRLARDCCGLAIFRSCSSTALIGAEVLGRHMLMAWGKTIYKLHFLGGADES